METTVTLLMTSADIQFFVAISDRWKEVQNSKSEQKSELLKTKSYTYIVEAPDEI